MASHHPSEIDSYATDSVASSPRSDIHSNHDAHARVRFMCSFGGKIVPRPHDNQLRYVGGDTRIVAVSRTATFATLLSKLSKLTGNSDVVVKYQLPNEDLDALISVTTDEDLENMMDEYDRVAQNQNPKSNRLRLFLFPKGEEYSATNSIASLLHGSGNHDHWFIDALNSGGSGSGGIGRPNLERNRSEASSIVSEVPDYLFGLDNSDETQTKSKTRAVFQETVSVSDPGSPAPVVTPQFSSIPNLPPVKTKPDNPNLILEPGKVEINADLTGPIQGNQVLHYLAGPNYPGQAVHHPVPFYYVPGHGHVQQAQQSAHGNVASVPLQHLQMHSPYVHVQYPGQVSVGYTQQVPGLTQVYGGGGVLRPAAPLDPRDMSPRLLPVADAVGHHMVYGVRNQAHTAVPGFAGMVVPSSGADEMRGPGPVAGVGPDSKSGKVLHS